MDAAPSGSPRRFPVPCFLVLLAALWLGPAPRAGASVPAVGLAPLQVASAEELLRALEEEWGAVSAEQGAVPAVAPRTLPAGLAALPVREKKRAFLRAVLPLVVSVNDAVARERARLQGLVGRGEGPAALADEDRAWLAALARRYRVAGAAEKLAAGEVAPVVRELLLRVDVVPASLALAQAALESGWGTSRFALEGNSLFGQWVFSGKGGMDPAERPAGARHRVARFADLRSSVEAYVRNLNTSWAYGEYRELRARQRAGADGTLDATALAGGLLRYSTRREAYVREVRAVIRGNRLARFDAARLVPARGALAGTDAVPAGLALGAAPDAIPPDA